MSIKDLIPAFGNKKRLPVRRFDTENPFQALQREMNRIFDNFFRDFRLAPFSERFGGMFPQLDIKETDKELKIEAELPGMDDKDIDISLSDNMLTIRGEKRQEKEEKGGRYYHIERSYGAFHRDIPLPCEVETDKVDAVFRKGVLSITLPKKPESKRKEKKIEIKVL